MMPGRSGLKMRRYSAPVSTFPQRRSRKTTLAFWEKNLGDTLLNNIDAPLVEDYLHLLQQQGYAPNSINRFREMLSILFNLASSPRWNMTKNNPMKYTQKRKSPPE